MAKLLLIEDDSDNVPAFSTSESCTTFPSSWRRPRGKEGGEAPAFGLTTKGGTISGGAKSCDAGRTDTLRTTFVFVQPLNDSGLLRRKIRLRLSKIKSEYIRGAIRRGLGCACRAAKE
jgi:hypothetical protein